MIVSKKAVDFIVNKEVSGKAFYDKRLTGICWPGGDSGATVGIGYDLGYQTPVSINADWIMQIGINQVNILKMFAGLKGNAAKNAVLGNKMATGVFIPFMAAYNVFLKTSLAAAGRRALSIYPGLDKLTPDAIGAIVSLVFNRGSSLEGDRRVEMKNIVPLVANKDYEGIAKEIEGMKRLWTNGLVERRQQEADLVRGSLRQYANEELIEI